jgi:hypothetical protein
MAEDANPRNVRGRDPKLDRECEYLVFDLGKGVELKLVKIAAKGKTFTIGSTREEQEKVIRDYFDGKKPGTLDYEEAASVTLTDDYYIGQFEVYRAQFRRFVEETKYVTDAEMLEGGYGYDEEKMKFEGRDRKYTWQNTGVSSAGERHPVTNVSRNDARKFCEWLMTRSDGKIKIREVRLPGEAEWEFACRAGSAGRSASVITTNDWRNLPTSLTPPGRRSLAAPMPRRSKPATDMRSPPPSASSSRTISAFTICTATSGNGAMISTANTRRCRRNETPSRPKARARVARYYAAAHGVFLLRHVVAPIATSSAPAPADMGRLGSASCACRDRGPVLCRKA